MKNNTFFELSNGDISIALEQGALHLKAGDKISGYQDPIELNEQEALELIEVLSSLIKRIKKE